jgi:serine protease Do
VVTEKVTNGVKIKKVVKNSPSVNSLKVGDVIVKINERTVDDENRLVAIIQTYLPGEEVTVHYIRNNKSESAKIKLGERSSSEGMKFLEKDFFEKDVRVLLKDHDIPMPFLKNLRPALGMKIQDLEVGDGAKVLEVTKGSIAEKAGLLKDDIIFELDGKEVKRTKDVKEAYNETKEKTTVIIKVKRKGLIQSFELKIPKKIETLDL